MAQDVEISRGIVVNPGRCGGHPTIKGTRLTVDWLARVLSGPDPMDPRDLIEQYDVLSFDDIVNVRGWVRKGCPGASAEEGE